MSEESQELKCPKCGSAALSVSTTTMPHTTKKYKRIKCLNCGVQFDKLDE
ncbi:hypothetical protein GF374_01780 [Candidatus Woesearchaeota archaeon]|nr:hypothetical protein [Candidatus Woesearchaeota archaeon]